jgi:hypothetical protein
MRKIALQEIEMRPTKPFVRFAFKNYDRAALNQTGQAAGELFHRAGERRRRKEQNREGKASTGSDA